VRTNLLVLTRVYVPASAAMMSFGLTGLFFGGVLELGRAVAKDAVASTARIGLLICIVSADYEGTAIDYAFIV
jgi:hypothetical protein